MKDFFQNCQRSRFHLFNRNFLDPYTCECSFTYSVFTLEGKWNGKVSTFFLVPPINSLYISDRRYLLYLSLFINWNICSCKHKQIKIICHLKHSHQAVCWKEKQQVSHGLIGTAVPCVNFKWHCEQHVVHNYIEIYSVHVQVWQNLVPGLFHYKRTAVLKRMMEPLTYGHSIGRLLPFKGQPFFHVATDSHQFFLAAISLSPSTPLNKFSWTSWKWKRGSTIIWTKIVCIVLVKPRLLQNTTDLENFVLFSSLCLPLDSLY